MTLSAVAEPRTIGLKNDEFDLLRRFVYQLTGISFPDHKKQLFQSRLRKRLRHYSFDSFKQYYDFLVESDRGGKELIEMINCITTNKTDFFREEHHFDYLKESVFPGLVRASYEGKPKRVRIWSAACSSGEEPYSIAMTILEFFGSSSEWDIRILASDIDTNVLQSAKAGVFRNESALKIPPALLKKYFRPTGSGEEVEASEKLKQLITFRRINFSDSDWSIHTRFDVIFCRNAMIYFDKETQSKLVQKFSRYLDPGKHLFLGHSESLVQTNQLFTPLKQTMFKRTENGAQAIAPNPDSQSRSSTAKSGRSSHRKGQPSRGLRSNVLNKPVLNNDRSKSVRRFSKNNHRSPKPNPAAAPHTRVDLKLTRKPIIVGEIFASREPVWISTLLGSCVAACLFDPVAKIGGMNHFLLPDGSCGRQTASYGIHAMELLINEMMGMGADRRRMTAKVFGGANVIKRLTRNQSVGEQNVRFIREFLDTESIPILSEKLGGDQGLQIQFLANEGRARVKEIEKQLIAKDEEKRLETPTVEQKSNVETDDDSITLF